LGAAVGQGFARLSKRLKVEEKYLVTSGTSAGIAAAFNAPLAGTMFALEEIHKNISPIILISAISAALSSDFVAGEFFGLKPVLDLRKISVLPLHYYFYIIILGIIVGIAGVGFNKGLLKTQKIYSMQKWLPSKFRPVFCLMFSVLIGLFLPQVLGEGNSLIMSLTRGEFAIKFLIIMLVIKYIFSMMSGASGVPGGIFMPIFAIGALIGSIYGNILTYFFHVNSIYIGSFIILAMSGYFSSTIKAPFTGSILVIEMTGSFNNLLPVAVMSIVTYMVTELLNSKPIYETLLNKLLSNNGDSESIKEKGTKSILEIPVCLGSSLAGKKIKDIKWPSNCLIDGVKRGNSELIPKGDTPIYPGESLIILTDEYKLPSVQETLNKMTANSIIKN
jgi:H+/Cl- antiporter ClcA